ncbi:MAG: 30S ribosomal protein S17e [DPANN group archaeon]|nr:30S ribosomal protein S17e [DPANN group archaeon]
MGRVRAGFVKRQAEMLMKLYSSRFTAKFKDNKELVSGVAEVPTKKLRNLIAGYITKKRKKHDQ